MIPRVPDDLRAEIVRLRGERLTFGEIGRMVRLHHKTVQKVCEDHFGNLVERARAALAHEVAAARAEAHTAPLFHPEEWR